MVYVLPIGNALRILLNPVAGATEWRLLRLDTDAFAGPFDPSALVVHAGNDKAITDTTALFNGVTVYYRAYYKVGANWIASATKSGTPNATMADLSADPQTIVRNRLDLGLQLYVNRGDLIHVNNRIPVMTASPLMEETPLPVVTVHLASDASAERFIGDMVAADTFSQADGKWHSSDGWFSRVQLTIVGWCLNADERVVLRNAMKAVLMGNLSVFDAAGMMQVDLQFSDMEDFVTYAAPVYQAICNLTCYAPAMVDGTDPAILDVITSLK